MTQTVKDLETALFMGPPAPCATCALAERCKTQALACARYHYYVETPPPRHGRRQEEWKRKVYRNTDNADIPQRAVYDQIYLRGDDDIGGRPQALTPEEKDAIRYQISRGVSRSTLAVEFMVDRRTIWSCSRGVKVA